MNLFRFTVRQKGVNTLVGLVVGVSLVFFAAYYVCLVGGEELADRRIITPLWAMWTPNMVFGVVGLVALYRTRKASTNVRGAGLMDLIRALPLVARSHRA